MPGRRARHAGDQGSCRRSSCRTRTSRSSPDALRTDDRGRAADAEVADEVRALGRGRRRPPLAALERQAALRPVAPRARVEASFAAAEPGAVEGDARRDARAAVRDELSRGKLGQRFVPRSVRSARDPSGRIVDRRSARRASGSRSGHRRARAKGRRGGARSPPRRPCRRPLARDELRRLDLLLAGAQLASPRVTSAEQSPRSRRGRSGGAATTAARLRRSEPYATTKTPAPIPARPAAASNFSAAGSGWRPASGTERSERSTLDVEERRARDVTRRGRARGHGRDSRAPNGSRRTGSACLPTVVALVQDEHRPDAGRAAGGLERRGRPHEAAVSCSGTDASARVSTSSGPATSVSSTSTRLEEPLDRLAATPTLRPNAGDESWT